ncbi:hypothetical protein [Streptomyces sp. SP18CS02]|uniref:hypothetical protein n=1 Tax=Streptomyces sp. SP18CS02 TaxID=3002531 RepID=UPI002E77A72C|nr:hypothetical protein [Streptomyces sp. SP18CS02]MEE1755299.1 hypothetical protein [Streptomyces sp. SP18CS02]
MALATFGMMVGTTSGSAWAIDHVPCNNNEFVNAEIHYRFAGGGNACFANAGEFHFWDQYAEGIWRRS